MYYVTLYPSEVNYEGDADGLVALLVQDGFLPSSATRLVQQLRQQQVLVVPGMLRGYFLREEPRIGHTHRA